MIRIQVKVMEKKARKNGNIKRSYYIQPNAGSITVEAAFAMPLVLYMIIALIYLTFWLYDQNLVHGTVDKALHKAEITLRNDADIESGTLSYKDINNRGIFYPLIKDDTIEEDKITDYLNRELAGRLFLSKVTEVEAEINNTRISIWTGVETKVKLPVFSHLFDPVSRTEITAEGRVHNPAEAVRAAEVILETGSKVKGAEELMDKLSD